MQVTEFGEMTIKVEKTGKPEIMHITIEAENRKEPITMDTNVQETIDQLTTRFRSMLRALFNSEVRKTEKVEVRKPQDQTWAERKEAATK